MRRPILVPARGGTQRMRKHIDRVFQVGTTVVVLLAFGNPALTLPAYLGYNTDDAPKAEQTEQTSSE